MQKSLYFEPFRFCTSDAPGRPAPATTCRSPKLRKAINLVRVTMLQALHILFISKAFFDFGENQAGILLRIPVSRLAPTIAISLNAASYKCLNAFKTAKKKPSTRSNQNRKYPG
jgi:hypothetical protein